MTDTSDREIGRRIAALRKQRGWSQSYLASLVGTDQSVLSRIEAAKRRIGARELDRLAKALGVEPATLLPDEVESPASAAFSADTRRRDVCSRAPPGRCQARRPAPRNGESQSRPSLPMSARGPPRRSSGDRRDSSARRPARTSRRTSRTSWGSGSRQLSFSPGLPRLLGLRPHVAAAGSECIPGCAVATGGALPAALRRDGHRRLPAPAPELGARCVPVERVVGLGRRARAAALGRQAVRIRRRPARRLRQLERAARPLRAPLAPRARHRSRHARARPRRPVRGRRGRRGDRRPPRGRTSPSAPTSRQRPPSASPRRRSASSS